LTRKEERYAQILVNLGMQKKTAKVLVFLAEKPEVTSVDIENHTSLSQPEVSITMQDLRNKKWVDKIDIKKTGRGRPIHHYRLAMPFREIIKSIERLAATRIREIERSIVELRREFAS